MAVPELLTVEKVAALMSRHPKTILRLFRCGELPGIKLGAHTVRFDAADVEAYIDRHRTPA